MVDAVKPILYDSTTTSFIGFGIGTLKDAISCTVTQELNGAFELELQYPVLGAHFKDIKIRSIILAGTRPQTASWTNNLQPFRVYSITKDASGHVATILARHVFYDLNGVPVSPFSGTDLTDFITNMSSAMLVSNPFSFSLVDGGSLNPTADGIIEEPMSAGAVLEYLIGDPYYCELEFYNYWEVKLHPEGGIGTDRGFAIKYGKNLTSLTQENNCADLYTGVYVYYISGTGKVTGRIVRVSGYSYDNLLPVDVSDQFEDTPTSAQLLTAANNYIAENKVGVPDVNLTVSFTQRREPDYLLNSERVELGDTVYVQFAELGITATTRVIRTVYDVLADRMIEVSVGEDAQSLSGTIATSANKTDRTADSYRQTQNIVNKYCLRYREQLTSGSLDDIDRQGHYYVVTANIGNVSGAPSGISVGYNVIHFNSAGSRAMQILYSNSSSISKIFWRICTSGGSWTPWVAVENDTPTDISAGFSASGTSLCTASIAGAYYSHGFVTLRINTTSNASVAAGSAMTGQVTFPAGYAPKIAVNSVSNYQARAFTGLLRVDGTFDFTNCGSSSMTSGHGVNMTFTYPCG